MTPFQAKMIHDRPLQRLAPTTPHASGAAVTGLAHCSHRAPDRLDPEQIRPSLHPVLVARQLAGSSCNQGAGGLQCFATTTLGWDARHLTLPPRTGRSHLPRVLSGEARPRLVTSAKPPKPRALRTTPYAAGLRVREVVPLPRTDIERARRRRRVEHGTGRQDRATRLATRLLADRRASWQL